MNSRLGISGAYNRSKDSSGSSKTASRDNLKTKHDSALINRLEKEVTSLQEENLNLKMELLELRQSVKQIFSENNHEKFDERRINLIKFQVIQLERQISLLNEALGSRSDAVLEVENTMNCLADKLRSYLSSEVQGPMVSISRKDLVALIEGSESARIKLFKSIENVNKDQVGKPLIVLNPFLGGKSKEKESLSLLDVCLHRFDYLNLRHVAQTETKLSGLYKELIRLHNQLEFLQGKGNHDLLLTAHIRPRDMERTSACLMKSCVMLKDVSDDLLSLSLLCPSAPWPALKKPLTKDIPVERVLQALPPLPSSKQCEVNQVVTASIGTCNHRLHLKEKEKAMLKEEIAFQQSVYDTQMQYTQAVLDAIRAGYKEFESTIKKVLSKPVKNLLDAYTHLKTSASEIALRNILLVFKENEAELSSIIEMLEAEDPEDESQGYKALSSFGEEFMQKVDNLVKSHKKNIEPSVRIKVEVREEQRRLETELRQLLEELENKYDKQWNPGYKINHVLPPDDQNNSTLKTQKNNDVNSLRNSELSCEISVKDPHLPVNKLMDVVNPVGLRAYLDDDYRQSAVKERRDSIGSRNSNEKCKTARSSDISESANNSYGGVSEGPTADRYQNVEKTKATFKKSKKAPWRPQKEWVGDFSKSTEASQERDSSDLLCNNEQLNEREDSKHSHLTLPHLSSKRGKRKESLNYEPNLRTAQRTLTLKREGSLSRNGNGRKE